jgi:hypothetical protein
VVETLFRTFFALLTEPVAAAAAAVCAAGPAPRDEPAENPSTREPLIKNRNIITINNNIQNPKYTLIFI